MKIVGLVLKSFEKLPAEFSFTDKDRTKFELNVGPGMKTKRSMQVPHKAVKEIVVKGTYDKDSRHIQGTITGVWEDAPAEGLEANGNVEIRFNVTVLKPN